MSKLKSEFKKIWFADEPGLSIEYSESPVAYDHPGHIFLEVLSVVVPESQYPSTTRERVSVHKLSQQQKYFPVHTFPK
jgi:hypothetical protein